jgi:glycosyltransferase involved in cell wall biosynthesis
MRGNIVKEGKIKVMFITDSLYPVGGVERVFGRILRYLDRSIFNPMVLVIGPYQDMGLELPRYVPVKYLGKKHARNTIGDLMRVIKTAEPDVIYSAKTHINVVAVLANRLAGRSSCIILSEHVHLSAQLRNQPSPRKWKLEFIFLLARILYRWAADKIVFVSKEALQDGCMHLRFPDDKVIAIYNPIVDDVLFETSEESVDHPWFARKREKPTILAVGRLTKQKGFSYLLKAFHQTQNTISARLVVVGEGEGHQQLTNLAETLGVKDDVAFLGFQCNPYKFMAKADVFVLSSLLEGLPTVLVEAMACGAPVVSTRCPSGPEEIITDGVNGLLVPPADPDALAEAIIKVLTNPEMARKMALAGKQRAEDFRVEKIVRQYEQLFESVLEEKA